MSTDHETVGRGRASGPAPDSDADLIRPSEVANEETPTWAVALGLGFIAAVNVPALLSGPGLTVTSVGSLLVVVALAGVLLSR